MQNNFGSQEEDENLYGDEDMLINDNHGNFNGANGDGMQVQDFVDDDGSGWQQ